MITKLKMLLKTNFASISTLRQAAHTNKNEGSTSTARRIGPNRVLLNARIIALPDNASLGNIGVAVLFCSFKASKPDEEAVVVSILNSDNSNVPNDCTIFEKRATLNVKQGTKMLSITFTDEAGRVQKSERIKIK